MTDDVTHIISEKYKQTERKDDPGSEGVFFLQLDFPGLSLDHVTSENVQLRGLASLPRISHLRLDGQKLRVVGIDD